MVDLSNISLTRILPRSRTVQRTRTTGRVHRQFDQQLIKNKVSHERSHLVGSLPANPSRLCIGLSEEIPNLDRRGNIFNAVVNKANHLSIVCHMQPSTSPCCPTRKNFAPGRST